MKTKDGAMRHFLAALALAVLLYIVAFHLIESCRVAKKPWQVEFRGRTTEVPSLTISRADIPSASTKVVFENGAATNDFRQTIVFDTARPVPFEVPFGKCIFLDTSFLPGTVTLQCFGHEIEMIPRVLIIDHKEYAWTNGAVIRLQ